MSRISAPPSGSGTSGHHLGGARGHPDSGRAGRREQLAPLLKGCGAVPPLVTDINRSLDDRFLYISCWGPGSFSSTTSRIPFRPKLTGSIHLGGIVRRAAHPRSGPLNGGPRMVEVSRDGKRVYLTNGLYKSWGDQFYPDGLKGWLVKLDTDPGSGFRLDPDFLVQSEQRFHRVDLEGGDASSDSYCFA